MIKKFKNVRAEEINLTNTFSCFTETVPTNFEKSNLALANTRSRLRMLTLYYYATINDSIVVGTGNKVEDFESDSTLNMVMEELILAQLLIS